MNFSISPPTEVVLDRKQIVEELKSYIQLWTLHFGLFPSILQLPLTVINSYSLYKIQRILDHQGAESQTNELTGFDLPDGIEISQKKLKKDKSRER